MHLLEKLRSKCNSLAWSQQFTKSLRCTSAIDHQRAINPVNEIVTSVPFVGSVLHSRDEVLQSSGGGMNTRNVVIGTHTNNENTRNNVNETKREKGVNIKGDVYGAQKAFKNATKITLVNAFRKALMYGMVYHNRKEKNTTTTNQSESNITITSVIAETTVTSENADIMESIKQNIIDQEAIVNNVAKTFRDSLRQLFCLKEELAKLEKKLNATPRNNKRMISLNDMVEEGDQIDPLDDQFEAEAMMFMKIAKKEDGTQVSIYGQSMTGDMTNSIMYNTFRAINGATSQ